MAAAQVAQITISPSPLLWSTGATFDGYLLLTLSATEMLKNSLIPLTLPLITRIPIVDGLIDTETRVYFNSDMVPPGSTYLIQLYDKAGNAKSTVAAMQVISADPTALTITTPAP